MEREFERKIEVEKYIKIGGSKHMQERKYIVFGQEHYNPLGIIRSLGENKIFSIAIIIKGQPAIASKSKYISRLHLVDTIEEGYQVLIKEYGNFAKDCLPFILTSDDKITGFFDEHYDELKDRFLFFNAGEAGRITYFMDKDNVNNLARRHGINVAKTWRTERGGVPDSIEFPVITKAISSNSGGWKNDVFVCHSKEELMEAYGKIKSEEVLLQKYIEKKNEVCLDGFSVNKGKKVFVSMGSSYEYILPDRYSTYIYFYRFDNQSILDKIQNMMAEVGFEGIFTVEFLVGQDNELYFLEINFRNSGWSYASTCWGMNLPLMWCEGMIDDEKMFYQKDIPNNAKAMVEISDFKTRVLDQKMNPFKWLSECRKCQCLFYYNKYDPNPFWSSLFGKIVQHSK